MDHILWKNHESTGASLVQGGDRKSVEQLRFLDYRVSESSFFIAAFVCTRSKGHPVA